MAIKLEHLHIKTRDAAKTARFYMEHLGATLIETGRNGALFRLDLHGLTLNISDHVEGQKRVQTYGLEHLALETDDLDGTLARMKDDGATVLEELISPHPVHRGGRICFLETPDGVQLELVEILP